MRPRPSVLHVIRKLHLGGSEQVAISLVESLHPHFDFTVFAVGGVSDDDVGQDMLHRLRLLGIPVMGGTPLDMKLGGLLHGAALLRAAIRRVRPDVVHLHTDIPDATYAASTMFVPGRPREQVVRTIHNTVLWPRWVRVGRWVERRLEDAHMVGVSRAAVDALQHFRVANGLKPLPDSQCEVVLNGVNVPGAARERRVPRDRVRVLFAGRFELQKGVDLLPGIIEQAASLTNARVDVTVAGSGSLEPFLQSWAAQQRTGWNVRVVPPVANLPEHLGTYDVVLMPSRFEGLALMGIECALAGTPVIFSDVDGLRDIFPAGSPLACPPEDVAAFARRLADVVNTPDRYAADAEAYVNTATRRFSLERMADDYRGVYEVALHRAVVRTPVTTGRPV